MWKTILRRVLIMLPQLFLLSILVFAMGHLMPGDPFTGLITPDTSPEVIEALKIKAGFYDPLHVQYFRWLGNVLRGDFGMSYIHRQSVLRIINTRASNTFFLSLLTVTLLYAFAIPLGIISGRYTNSWADKLIGAYNFVCFAIPTFVLSLVFIVIFGYKLRWFPTSGSVTVGIASGTFTWYLDKLHHMLLPALTVALLRTAGVTQYLRNEIIDAKTMDYVKTARSKGVPIDKVYHKHILRNSLLPISAFLGFTITGLLGGSIFIETIFAYPGMGELFVSSIISRDYSVIMALTLLFGALNLFGSLLSDIIMSIVDPRIRID